MTDVRRFLPPFVGRADLVRAGLDLEGADRARASWFGFDYRAKAATRESAVPEEFSDTEGLFDAKIIDELMPLDTIDFPVYCRRLSTREEPNPQDTTPPQELANVVWGNRPKRPPKFYPLASGRRVQHLVEGVINSIQVRGRPDIPRVIRKIAQGQPLVAVPRQETCFRSERLQLILDRSTRLTPLWTDQSLMVSQIRRLFPQLDLMIWILEEATGRLRPLSRDMPSQPAPSLGPLLVLGDLGLMGRPQIVAWWRELARDFVFNGGTAHSVLPISDDTPARNLIGPWQTQSWEVEAGVSNEGQRPDVYSERLLTLASPTVRLEPGLLRSLRRNAVPNAGVVDEIAVWQHPSLASRSAEAASFDPDARASYTRRLVGLANYHPETVSAGLATIRDWRYGGADEIWYEEVLGLPAALRDDSRFVDQADLDAADAFFANMHGTAAKEGLSSGQEAWLSRIGHRHKKSRDGIWQHGHAAAALVSVLKQDPNFVPPVIVESQPNAQDWHANVTRDQNGVFWISKGKLTGQPIGTLTMRGSEVEIIDPETDLRQNNFELPSNGEQVRLGEIPAPFVLQSGRSRMVVDEMDLSALRWADEVTIDAVGPRADLVIGENRLRFRWVPPGHGTVGPNSTEMLEGTLQRRDEIVFSSGFWLMERPLNVGEMVDLLDIDYTSRIDSGSYQGGEYTLFPANEVTLHDVEQAFDAVRETNWEARLRLPTPLEWEYACRAGEHAATTYNGTPEVENVFDHTLSDIAWYRPTNAMANSADRQMSILEGPQPSKQKRPNAWGFYDMLGNVAEWCEPDTSDPDDAVVKGGSFKHQLPDIRSAFGQKIPIGHRTDWIGVRPAIGKAEIDSLRMVPRPSTKFIRRNRAPRVQIEYDLELYGAEKRVQLPFVIGVMADLSGNVKEEPKTPLEDRKFLEINVDNFDRCLKSIAPRIQGQVEPRDPSLSGNLFPRMEDEPLQFDLTFESMRDLTPYGIAELHPALSEHLDTRRTLAAFLQYFDGKSALSQTIETFLKDEALVTQLADAMASYVRLSRAGMEEPRQTNFEGNYKELEFIGDVKLPVSSKTEALYLATLALSKVMDGNSRHEGMGAVDLINDLIKTYDIYLSSRVNAILHSAVFRRVESAWRGLQYLVNNVETDQTLKIRVLDISKDELIDVTRKFVGSYWDRSPIYRKLYEEEYGHLGGEPYSVILGDFEFSHAQQDVQVLSSMARIASTSFAPFIASASPSLLQLQNWSDIPYKIEEFETQLASEEHSSWHALRNSEDAAFLGLAMPRVLARGFFGSEHAPADSFDFLEDGATTEHGMAWMSAAYPLVSNIARSFKETGWTSKIRGIQSGGEVANLPTIKVQTEDGDVEGPPPISVAITDREEAELSRLGLMPLVHRKHTDKAAFISANSLQKPPTHSDPAKSKDAQLQSRLPYLFPALRFGQYLKVMARDKIGTFKDRKDMQNYLQAWINQYVLLSAETASEAERARKPLASAEVQIDQAGASGEALEARFFIRPHYQLEGMDTSLRLVTKLPFQLY